MAEAVPQKRNCCFTVPSCGKLAKQCWNTPIAMRVIELIPKRIAQLRHQFSASAFAVRVRISTAALSCTARVPGADLSTRQRFASLSISSNGRHLFDSMETVSITSQA
jgi:hypothetical protein